MQSLPTFYSSPIFSKNSSSHIISTDRLFAFSNLLQAFSQASKKSVFLLTLDTNSQPFFSKISTNLSLEIFSQFFSKLPVIQTFFPAKKLFSSKVFSSCL